MIDEALFSAGLYYGPRPESITTIERARVAMAALFPGHDARIELEHRSVSSHGQPFATWLVSLPAGAVEVLQSQGYIEVERAPFTIIAEWPDA